MNIKQTLNKTLNIDDTRDYEITIVRTMGDKITFHNYDKENITLYDDCLTIKNENTTRKILYSNITTIKYKQIFQNKIFTVVEGNYKEKGGTIGK